MTTSIADLSLAVAHPPLLGRIGSALLRAINAERDALLDKMRQAMRARMPGIGTLTALPYLSADRRIARGFQETDAAFAARLESALDTWAHAGSAVSLLTQLAGYVSPSILTLRTVSDLGNWDSSDDGATVWHWRRNDMMIPADNWDWDAANGVPTTMWWRAWVVIYAGALWASDGLWGDAGLWGDGGAWGTDMSVLQARAIRAIVGTWKAAHASIPWIILAFDSTWFAPTALPGAATLPSGDWGRWAKVVGGVYVQSRTTTARYLDGVT